MEALKALNINSLNWLILQKEVKKKVDELSEKFHKFLALKQSSPLFGIMQIDGSGRYSFPSPRNTMYLYLFHGVN